MTFIEFENDSFCVGGRRRSRILNIYGDITSKGSKVFLDYCSICNRKKSMTVSDNTIKAEGPGKFCENLGKKGLNVSKKMAKKHFEQTRKSL